LVAGGGGDSAIGLIDEEMGELVETHRPRLLNKLPPHQKQ
jgi:hypothetical protein